MKTCGLKLIHLTLFPWISFNYYIINVSYYIINKIVFFYDFKYIICDVNDILGKNNDALWLTAELSLSLARQLYW